MATTKISYWQVFRIIFVVFFLYLASDAFYRWDGFIHYGTFSEFLPGLALIAILWSVVSVFAAILVWLPLRALVWFSQSIGWKIKAESLLIIVTFMLLVAMFWHGEQIIWPRTGLPLILKWVVFLCITLIATFLTLLFCNKPEQWMGIIQERITPIVWLFCSVVLLSVPIVAYHAWEKQTDQAGLQETIGVPALDRDRPNIVLVVFDALAARDMSAYGYHRPTTPFIQKWAEKAVLFSNVQAESNFTTPTVASLMTGKRVWTHQTYHLHGSKPVKSDVESLPLLLKNKGYYNMAFVANPHASVGTLGVSNGFEIAPRAAEFWTPASLLGVIDATLNRFFGDKIRLYDWFIQPDFIPSTLIRSFPGKLLKTEKPPEKVFYRFLSVLDDNPPEPFFAWVLIFPPHNPYLPPKPYKGMFTDSQRLRTRTQDSKEKYSSLRTRYDEFIRFCDKEFEDFIAQLKKRNKLKNTVIILSSDHGESFEHDYLGHGGPHLYEQVTHIPLIIKESGQSGGRIINNLIKQIDIPATILDLANIPIPSWMEGRSLLPLMRGRRRPPYSAVFSMNFERNPSLGHQITKGTIAVWEGDYKLIHYLKENKSLLFNLKKDPDEVENLFERDPETGQRLFNLIQDNLKKANERISQGK